MEDEEEERGEGGDDELRRDRGSRYREGERERKKERERAVRYGARHGEEAMRSI